MAVDYYLLPNAAVGTDTVNARDWLEREQRRVAEVPGALDQAAESRKRRLADLLLGMKPEFREFQVSHEEIAKFERISVDEARLKYRHIEINGPGVQFTVFDNYVDVGVYSTADLDELDALLAALSAEGRFVLYDPQSDEVTDLNEDSRA